MECVKSQVGLILFDLNEAELVDNRIQSVFKEQLAFVIERSLQGVHSDPKTLSMYQKAIHYGMKIERASIFSGDVLKKLKNSEQMSQEKEMEQLFFKKTSDQLKKIVHGLEKIRKEVQIDGQSLNSLRNKALSQIVLLRQFSSLSKELDKSICDLSNVRHYLDVYPQLRKTAEAVISCALRVGMEVNKGWSSDSFGGSCVILSEIETYLQKKKTELREVFFIKDSVEKEWLVDQIDILLEKIKSHFNSSMAFPVSQSLLGIRLIDVALKVGGVFIEIEEKLLLEESLSFDAGKELRSLKKNITAMGFLNDDEKFFFVHRMLNVQKMVLNQEIEKVSSEIKNRYVQLNGVFEQGRDSLETVDEGSQEEEEFDFSLCHGGL